MDSETSKANNQEERWYSLTAANAVNRGYSWSQTAATEIIWEKHRDRRRRREYTSKSVRCDLDMDHVLRVLHTHHRTLWAAFAHFSAHKQTDLAKVRGRKRKWKVGEGGPLSHFLFGRSQRCPKQRRWKGCVVSHCPLSSGQREIAASLWSVEREREQSSSDEWTVTTTRRDQHLSRACQANATWLSAQGRMQENRMFFAFSMNPTLSESLVWTPIESLFDSIHISDSLIVFLFYLRGCSYYNGTVRRKRNLNLLQLSLSSPGTMNKPTTNCSSFAFLGCVCNPTLLKYGCHVLLFGKEQRLTWEMDKEQ